MPALNQALMLSKPLHFGDYGGLVLKLIWAAMTTADWKRRACPNSLQTPILNGICRFSPA